MKMIRSLSILSLGAAAMYLLDPRLGHRRRAMLQDQVRGTLRSAARRSRRLGRNLSYRSRGLLHQLGDRIQSGRQQVSDPVLQARVRTRIGRHLEGHPHTFNVVVDHGHVLLTGDISDALYQKIHPVLRRMTGVQSVRRSPNIPIPRAA